MQPEAQTTTRDSLAVSAGALEIAIVIQGTLEVLSRYLLPLVDPKCADTLIFLYENMEHINWSYWTRSVKL